MKGVVVLLCVALVHLAVGQSVLYPIKTCKDHSQEKHCLKGTFCVWCPKTEECIDGDMCHLDKYIDKCGTPTPPHSDSCSDQKTTRIFGLVLLCFFIFLVVALALMCFVSALCTCMKCTKTPSRSRKDDGYISL